MLQPALHLILQYHEHSLFCGWGAGPYLLQMFKFRFLIGSHSWNLTYKCKNSENHCSDTISHVTYIILGQSLVYVFVANAVFRVGVSSFVRLSLSNNYNELHFCDNSWSATMQYSLQSSKLLSLCMVIRLAYVTFALSTGKDTTKPREIGKQNSTVSKSTTVTRSQKLAGESKIYAHILDLHAHLACTYPFDRSKLHAYLAWTFQSFIISLDRWRECGWSTCKKKVWNTHTRSTLETLW